MTQAIRERIPITVIGAEAGHSSLVGRRFMGTLLHPVPRIEMERRCGAPHPGMKLVADWPADCDTCSIPTGTEVEVEGRRYRVCGIDERAGCYVELYLAPAS
ncbi:MAG TPA: hypothetical protein VFB58_18650 [Chloroflexota bacterium]|nr:hypothetical protein [Chloroflexota bacterium]